MAEALRLAAPEGHLHVFVDEGAAMAGLLGRLATPDQREPVAAAGDVPPDYLARLPAPPTWLVGLAPGQCQGWPSR